MGIGIATEPSNLKIFDSLRSFTSLCFPHASTKLPVCVARAFCCCQQPPQRRYTPGELGWGELGGKRLPSGWRIITNALQHLLQMSSPVRRPLFRYERSINRWKTLYRYSEQVINTHASQKATKCVICMLDSKNLNKIHHQMEFYT